MIRRVAAGAAVSLLAAAALTGCSASTSAPGVELVIGAHANQPMTVPDSTTLTMVQNAVEHGASIGAVTVDGSPAVARKAAAFAYDTTSDESEQTSLDAAQGQLSSLLRTSATVKGADLLRGLVLAADDARSATPAIHDVAVFDNGLSDTGVLDFPDPALLSTKPSSIAQQLLSTSEISPTTFKGLTVRFYGLGSAAAPQAALSGAQVAKVGAIYKAVVEAGGGVAEVSSAPLQTMSTGMAKGVHRALAVQTVKVLRTTLRLTPGVEQVYGDDSAIGFNGGSARFRDPAEARSFVRPLARWLAADSSRSVSLVGTTSSEGSATVAQDRALSTARADAVRDLLIAAGADAGQVSAVGKGYIADPKDTDATGAIVPAAAALNRAVRITVNGRRPMPLSARSFRAGARPARSTSLTRLPRSPHSETSERATISRTPAMLINASPVAQDLDAANYGSAGTEQPAVRQLPCGTALGTRLSPGCSSDRAASMPIGDGSIRLGPARESGCRVDLPHDCPGGLQSAATHVPQTFSGRSA